MKLHSETTRRQNKEMGGFKGHVLPGVYFVLFGIWWTIQIWRKYLKSFQKRNDAFQCQVLYPPKFQRCGVNIEAILLLTSGAIGILGELYLGAAYIGSVIRTRNIQHSVMYAFFILLGLFELIRHILKRRLLPNADDISYLSLAMAYFMEAMLFSFHLMGRDVIDTTFHTLLVHTIHGCAVLSLAEMLFRNQVLAALGRALFTTLQGTWFIQIAFILYSPYDDHVSWDPEDHRNVMLIACIYALHLGAVFLFSVFCGCIINCWTRKADEEDAEFAVQLLDDSA